MLLKDLNIDDKIERSMHQQSEDRHRQNNYNSNNLSTYSTKNANHNRNKRYETEANPYGFQQPPTFKNQNNENEKSRGLRPSSSSEHLKYRSRPESQWSSRKNDYEPAEREKYTVTVQATNNRNLATKLKITRDQQNAIV